MKNQFKNLIFAICTVVTLACVTQESRAVLITVDTILADNPADLSGSIEMRFVDADSLGIRFTNTSIGGASSAGGLLTGMAFNMGRGSIVGGTARIAPDSSGQVKNGPALAAGADVSGEWGYANGPGSGHFNGLLVNTQISTMQADTNRKFSNSPLANPSVLSGPEFGLLRTGGDPGGQHYISNSIVFVVDLNRSISQGNRGAFLRFIERGEVAVTFGSPSGNRVPDGGITILLLGLALVGIETIRRITRRAA